MNSKVEIKKPPDIETIDDNINEQVYRTIKCPLKTVLKNYDIIYLWDDAQGLVKHWVEENPELEASEII